MKKTILAVIKEPNEKPRFINIIGGNELIHNIQTLIGGNIDALPIDDAGRFDMVFSEDFRIKKLQPNVEHGGDYIGGTIVVLNNLAGKWCDMDSSEALLAMKAVESLKPASIKSEAKKVAEQIMTIIDGHEKDIDGFLLNIVGCDGKATMMSGGTAAQQIKIYISLFEAVAKTLSYVDKELDVSSAKKVLLDVLKNSVDDESFAKFIVSQEVGTWKQN